MIITNSKYAMSETKTSVYSVQMRLVIMNLQKQDLGGYKCISKNSIGDAEGNIRLYGEFFKERGEGNAHPLSEGETSRKVLL